MFISYIVRNKYVLAVLVFLFAVLLYISDLNVLGIEYRDDEVFYFNSAAEMLRTGNFVSPTYFGANRFQKPILFYWLIILSYQIWGVHWFAARLVAVFFAAASVSLTWLIAEKWFDRRVAFLSSLILMTIPLFYRHAKNAVPDMALNFFIVLSCCCALLMIEEAPRRRLQLLFFVSCALGFLIKGLAAVVVPFLIFIIFAFLRRKISVLKRLNLWGGVTVLALLVLPWFLYMIAVHGREYLQYLLVEETRNRLLVDGQNSVLSNLRIFPGQFGFYCRVIFSYFAPWSIFFFGSLPLFFIAAKNRRNFPPVMHWLWVWMGAVMAFFSFMFFKINHYMLILTTPFSILLSWFFLRGYSSGSAGSKLARAGILFMVCVGFLGLAFFNVFMAGENAGWLWAFLFGAIFSCIVIVRATDPLLPPAVLGALIVFFIAQASMMNKAGISTLPALQEFAAIIHQSQDGGQEPIIGVLSHDIHDKEWQAFFNQRILKDEIWIPQGILWQQLGEQLAMGKPVYCLITQKEFEANQQKLLDLNFQVVAEKYLFRKRLNLDSAFLFALWGLDRETIHGYLKEKILLLKRPAHA